MTTAIPPVGRDHPFGLAAEGHMVRRTGAMTRNELDELRERLAQRARAIGAQPVECETCSATSLGAAR